MTAVCCVLQDISLVYQIITDEMLGSGQFGVVFAGNAGLSSALCIELSSQLKHSCRS